jgi:hypothetical protein
MKVETCTALAVVLLFSIAATGAQADDKWPAPDAPSETTATQSSAEVRAPDTTAVMAQAPADPNAQVLQDIKVYPCF